MMGRQRALPAAVFHTRTTHASYSKYYMRTQQICAPAYSRFQRTRLILQLIDETFESCIGHAVRLPEIEIRNLVTSSDTELCTSNLYELSLAQISIVIAPSC